MPKKSEGLRHYYDALQLLVDGNPVRVPKGTKITLKSVSLEAGMSAGSIKKNRPIYAKLIETVELRASEQAERLTPQKLISESKREDRLKIKHYMLLYKETLGRELMLLRQLDSMERQLHSADNVVDFPKPEIE